MNVTLRTCLIPALTMLFVPWASAEDSYAGYGSGPTEKDHVGEKEYSPYLNIGYPQRVFWGDTHLHTALSTDAGMVGNTLGLEEAYRFALGDMVVASNGVRARLQRPLDFLVVADHAENLGLAPMIAERNPDLLATDFGRKIAQLVYDGKFGDAYALWGEGMTLGEDPLAEETRLLRTMWERVTKAAEQYNDPGKFTALIGFEWTASPNGNNMHRNVIFRDGKDEADQIVPISNYDSSDPEDLWAWMQAYEEKTGGRALAIPHNGNLSNGLMFDDETLSGKEIDQDYAERRMRWEPVYEVTQMKGDGEAHPALSPNDEFADYGTWDKGSFGPEPKTQDMLPREYAREAYKRGLQYEEDLGVNPFKFGMIGSTDSHTSLATTEENNFFGKATPVEPTASPERFEEKITGFLQEPGGPDVTIRHLNSLSSGLAAVWATDNTREAIWDALNRKEVYATTGTRITVRMFAGWDFEESEVQRPDFAKTGYVRGVPMGGDLKNAPDGKAPTFMIRALRDVDGANLDRIQIVKGWMDGDGELHEQVYDVLCSDDRAITDQHQCEKPVGNTVDVEQATYSNSIGDALMLAYWKDPDFDAQQRAFYYVRVLEIPTPRWSTYDAAFFGIDLPEEVEPTHQERAYTSPVWYTPGG
ncbi:DUF3604 domain-containing protein [Marinobacter sp. chi1]|uniref:DUF3604 domain-containing protein n=1 Tax=Marinobacter suaedae TaxID=3057675 RepID=A0ABT8VXP3_9GAMM|nr:DUF3604 domain-containing protein [Marinobacter sp. chi1]MDO3720769.1 DUF3604 domain-containing protein [Marinobacter sp. chi1]